MVKSRVGNFQDNVLDRHPGQYLNLFADQQHLLANLPTPSAAGHRQYPGLGLPAAIVHKGVFEVNDRRTDKGPMIRLPAGALSQ